MPQLNMEKAGRREVKGKSYQLKLTKDIQRENFVTMPGSIDIS